MVETMNSAMISHFQKANPCESTCRLEHSHALSGALVATESAGGNLTCSYASSQYQTLLTEKK
jgi:hypothetical protein